MLLAASRASVNRATCRVSRWLGRRSGMGSGRSVKEEKVVGGDPGEIG